MFMQNRSFSQKYEPNYGKVHYFAMLKNSTKILDPHSILGVEGLSLCTEIGDLE